MPHNRKLFLSIVSNEFASYRQLLGADLKRPSLDLATQEDFINTGGSTLEKLDGYIRSCHGVIHIIGKAKGAVPPEAAVKGLLEKYPDFATRLPPLSAQLGKPQPGFSYTQWEAHLALYHRRELFVYRPSDFDLATLEVPRGATFVFSADEEQSQRDHYRRICDLGHDRGQFLNEERLSSAVLRDLVEILPRLEPSIAVPPTKLRHTAELLIGRDADLARLDAAWNDSHKNVVIVRAFGGMGKTSLVATWMAELALKDWRGAERVFDWSFYSQGTSDQRAASADVFIANALKAFGDPDPTLGSAWDRGARLAHLVGSVRCLLVLDGLEPLQYPPGPLEGKLKDQAIEALLKGLAGQNAGLCIVTTREKVPDIQQHYGRTADDLELTRLTDLAGAALLHHLGATRAGAKEIVPADETLQSASREVCGHGLTLQLLGQYLRLVEGGDILKRDTVRLADADHEYQNDATRRYGHAFKAMEAYEKWFQREGERGQRQLAVLRLLGLFDRPASRECLDALRKEPVITGLTEALVGLSAGDWTLVASRLEEVNLLTVQADGSLDAHPLLREYFGQRLRAHHTEAWRAAHRRLYEYLCATTPDKLDATLEDLQPLYQAVAHGCQAGIPEEACTEVYWNRIQRGEEAYSTFKLGAVGSDLSAIACLFRRPWSELLPGISASGQAFMLSEAAFSLRTVGRLAEALEPMRAGLESYLKQENWGSAARLASNLSELELTLGEVAEAVRDGQNSVTYADRSVDNFGRFMQVVGRASHADALHQAGRRPEAKTRFQEAEKMLAASRPDYPLLYSSGGFGYCDVLLTEAERAAWLAILGRSLALSEAKEACRTVSGRAAQTLEWIATQNHLVGMALDHLTLGRATLYAAVLSSDSVPRCAFDPPLPHLASAVSGFRRAGTQHMIPLSLLTRAWQRALTGALTISQAGSESAQSDLDEAWEIAERGPMPLFLADIHLYRARLFGSPNAEGESQNQDEDYPWQSPQHDLAEARRLIEKHGYLRRMPELEDAEAALLPATGEPAP